MSVAKLNYIIFYQWGLKENDMGTLKTVDEGVLFDFLRNYRLCFEKMNEVLVSVSKRVDLTDEEICKLKETEKHYQSMKYYARKSQWPIIKP